MDHAIHCHLCGKCDSYGPTRVRGILVFAFCQECHRTRRQECDDLMDRAAAPVPQEESKAA